jgi:hypothetical protein
MTRIRPARRRLFVAAALLVSAIWAASASAAFTVSSNYTMPIAPGPYSHPCVPDLLITLSGEIHSQAQVTFGDDGSIHLGLTDNFQDVKGVDQFGNTYVTTDTDSQSVQTLSPLPFVFTYVDAIHFLSQDPAIQDYYAYTKIHLTVNADGTVTAYDDDVTMECK